MHEAAWFHFRLMLWSHSQKRMHHPQSSPRTSLFPNLKSRYSQDYMWTWGLSVMCSHHNLFVSNVIKGRPELVLNGKTFVGVLWCMNKKSCGFYYERATDLSEKTQTWKFGQVSTIEWSLFHSSHLGWCQANKCFCECKEKLTVQEIKCA